MPVDVRHAPVPACLRPVSVPLSAPDIGEAENAAVARALRSGWVAPLGPEVDAFEAQIAARTGRAHGVALSSGTAALHLGLLGIGVGQGTVVVTSTFTFAATANAVTYTGAEPWFVDCCPATGNLCPELLEESLAQLAAAGRRVSAVLPVDIYGKVADLRRIGEVADRYGVPVLCDSAESLGARLDGRAAGSFGAAAAISFNGNKIMTTSGGGMLVTDDERLATTARRVASQARQPVRHYEHTEIGFNYRLSNVLAALGRAQLARLDDMMARRREIRDDYRRLTAGRDSVAVFQGADDRDDNCWLSSLLFADPAAVRIVTDRLAEAAIETRPLWKPLHRQPVFADLGRTVTGSADDLFARGLTLPSGSGLGADDRERVLDVLTRALDEVDGRA